MIRDEILQQLRFQGITQSELCRDLGYTISNFNAFLRGKRHLAYKEVVRVFDYLHLTFGIDGKRSTESPHAVGDLIRARIKEQGLKVKDVAEQSGVNASTIASLMNGKRFTSSKNIDKLLDTLGLGVVPRIKVEK